MLQCCNKLQKQRQKEEKRREVLVNVTNNISGFLGLYKCVYLEGESNIVLSSCYVERSLAMFVIYLLQAGL